MYCILQLQILSFPRLDDPGCIFTHHIMVDKFQLRGLFAFSLQKFFDLFVCPEHIFLGFLWRISKTKQPEIRYLLLHIA